MFGEKGNETNVRMSTPITRFLEFKKLKRDGKEEFGFVEYDKDFEAEVIVSLDKFIVIDEAYQLRGYSNKLKTYLKSNIVSNKKTDEFVVSHDGQEVYKGIYDPEVKPQWATLYRVLTVNWNGELTRLVLKPSVSKAYIYTFVEKFDDKGLPVEWKDFDTRYKFFVEIDGQEKKESSFGDYEVPKFKLGKKLTEKDIKETTELKDLFKDYLDSFKTNKENESKSLEGSN